MDVTQIGFSAASNVIDVKSMAADSLSRDQGSVFSEFLSGRSNGSMGSQSGKDYTSSQTKDTKTNDAYDRYRYKDNAIEGASTDSRMAKADELSGETAQLASDTVAQLANDLGVDEDAVKEAMETLGLTVLDLSQPQNLAALVKTVSGISDDAQILLDEGFCRAAGNVDALLQTFAQENNLSDGQMKELAAELSEQQAAANEVQTEPEAGNAKTALPESDQAGQDVVSLSESAGQATSEVKPEVVVEAHRSKNTQEQTQNEESSDKDFASASSMKDFERVETGTPFKKSEADSSDKKDSNDFSQNLAQAVNERLDQASDVADAADIPEYTSVDAQDIIDQIVEQTKVIFDSDTTTIEMQLNPENLGKIFLNISAKEGAVTAQLFAQNETVQAALQAQVAELTENLNQAGVKVDAIEISVATHEFERNLEQNAKGEKDQGGREEAQRSGRRNIKIDSLDDLSGLMTEEETLVARMMKDNGNSVDFTA